MKKNIFNLNIINLNTIYLNIKYILILCIIIIFSFYFYNNYFTIFEGKDMGKEAEKEKENLNSGLQIIDSVN